jgi:hypothetical protein
MQPGFNSDISVRGQKYHVQTEDWGPERGFLVSRVFTSGAVIKTIKLPYAEVFKQGPSNDAEAVRMALRRQHQRIVEELMASGG